MLGYCVFRARALKNFRWKWQFENDGQENFPEFRSFVDFSAVRFALASFWHLRIWVLGFSLPGNLFAWI